MKKRVIKIIASCIALLFIGVFFCQIFRIFCEKDEVGKNKALIAADESYDVFLMGSSHMGNIQPMELWEKYGITSYNIYNSGSGMKRNLATLNMALDYATPKLVVLDTDQWWSEKEFSEEPGDFHRTFDIFPLSLTKMKAVMMVTEDRAAQKELLFNFYRYHSRYQELVKEDFDEKEDFCLGSHLHFNSVPQKEFSPIGINELPEEEMDNPESLRKIIELCQSKGIDVMLTCLPFSAASENAQKRQHVINGIAEEYGIVFYNFLDHEQVINYECDLKDAGHLNISGARKTSKILAELMQSEYGIKDHRNDAEIAGRWNQKLETYGACIDEMAEDPKQVTWNEAFILLSMSRYSGEVYIKNSVTGFLRKPGVYALLKNATKAELPKLEEAIQNNEDYLLVYNQAAESVQEFAGTEVEDIMGSNEDLDNVLITLRNADTLDVVAEIREE